MTPFIDRRRFLSFSAAGVAVAGLSACSGGTGPSSASARILPTDPAVATREARRATTGTEVTKRLTASPIKSTVNGKSVATWGYDDAIRGPVIRTKAGDQLRAVVDNQLPEPTSIHWHGLALRNDQDGVPGVTQDAVAADSVFTYDFRVPHPGTHWYHSHVGTQRDRGLLGALIVEDPDEPLEYTRDWVIVLDDWLDGLDATPDETLERLAEGMSGMGHGSMPGMDHGSTPTGGQGTKSGGMAGMSMGSGSDYLGGDAGDVDYPVHLFNGKDPEEAETLEAAAGDVIRLRIINAAGDTAYRVGLPGQQLTPTHTDGYPVRHTDVDAVVLGMGERIDALVKVQSGTTAVLALPEGKIGQAVGYIDAGSGKIPASSKLPDTLEGKVVDGGKLQADPSVALSEKATDRTHELHLTGGMAKFDWGINGHRFNLETPYAQAFEVKVDERVEVVFINDTMMWHPMHLHGHTFQVGNDGARKDTVIVRPGETVRVLFDADNPGQWLTHCHNVYHAEQGMMGVFSYTN
ncbi:multicopper oxidase family protein [Brevibacterium antiquum]|uniref:Tat (Twin-arginine translocation) pathway signal sequence n=1 Tax=Brevibacterium antiquum CNRZ 918 TaxID=1255637 RepID=A0A2H1L197_9MICO|nr:multicopper oxidase family protein [Brevibacterium antiquum]SMY05242.1 Tat (twin-arginine translocation) pathway signal sequence [Brevibacterium antiquum CNRZ 918]